MKAMTSNVEIRHERPEDVDAIRALTHDAFEHAPHTSHTEAAIVDALRSAGALTVSLVAIEDGELVGHIAFSPVAITGEADGWYGLGPVSVRPDCQRRGIGHALIRSGLDHLRGLNARGCVVLGEPAYYGRFGFISNGALRYGDVPPEYLQHLTFHGSDPKGSVTYHRAFDAT